MNKLKIATDYIYACQTQEAITEQLDTVFQQLCPDNTTISVHDIILKPYRNLLEEILGTEAMDWIEYWQYESDYGKVSREFAINQKTYDTSNMTTYSYLEATCGFTK